MRQLLLICVLLFFGSVSAQGQRPLNQGRLATPPAEPTEEQLEERRRKIEERRVEYIENFLSTLESDDFQKQIIRITLNSYFDEKLKVYTAPYSHPNERTDAFKALDDTHFLELETLISEEDMTKLKGFIGGNFDDKEIKKKKKKKKKKKNKD